MDHLNCSRIWKGLRDLSIQVHIKVSTGDVVSLLFWLVKIISYIPTYYLMMENLTYFSSVWMTSGPIFKYSIIKANDFSYC